MALLGQHRAGVGEGSVEDAWLDLMSRANRAGAGGAHRVRKQTPCAYLTLT